MLLEAGIINFPVFRALVLSVEKVVDEIQFEIDGMNVHGQGLDRSHISYIEFNMKRGFFSNLFVVEPFKIAFDAEDLKLALKPFKDAKFVSMEMDKFSVTFRSKHPLKTMRRVNSIEMDYDPPSPPELETEHTTVIKPDKFFKALDMIKEFGDKVKLVSGDKGLLLMGDGIETTLQQKPNADELVSSVYNIDKLLEMKELVNFGNGLIMKIGNDKPLCLICNSKRPGAVFTYLLAPRIDENEFEESSPNEIEGEEKSSEEGGCCAEV